MLNPLEIAKLAAKELQENRGKTVSKSSLTAEEVCDIIALGDPIEANSTLLKERFYIVYGEAERSRLILKLPSATIYSWRELEQMAHAKVTSDHARKFHEIKKTLGAKIDSIERT